MSLYALSPLNGVALLPLFASLPVDLMSPPVTNGFRYAVALQRISLHEAMHVSR